MLVIEHERVEPHARGQLYRVRHRHPRLSRLADVVLLVVVCVWPFLPAQQRDSDGFPLSAISGGGAW